MVIVAPLQVFQTMNQQFALIDNCILLNVRVNFAKANLVAFFSSDNFNEYYDIEKSDKQIKLEKCSDIIKDILLQAIIMKRKNNYKLELEYPVIII
ncbi:unnamed protein product [Cunninghamella blakesleeana]